MKTKTRFHQAAAEFIDPQMKPPMPDADFASQLASKNSLNDFFTVTYDAVTAGRVADGLRYHGGVRPPQYAEAPAVAEAISGHTTLMPSVEYKANFAMVSPSVGPCELRSVRNCLGNTTMIMVPVAEAHVFMNPKMLDRTYVIDSNDYLASPVQERWLSLLHAGSGQFNRQSRALAAAVHAMKQSILAQNNDTNPYFNMPEAEMYDRILETMIVTARAVTALNNLSIGIALKPTIQVGARRYYDATYRWYYTADYVARLTEKMSQLSLALRGMPVLPTMLRDYLAYGTIQPAPVQEGSVRLLQPVLGHGTYARSSQDQYITGISAWDGDATLALSALPWYYQPGQLVALQAYTLNALDAMLDYFLGAECSVVRTSTLGFSAFIPLQAVKPNGAMYGGSELVATMCRRAAFLLGRSQLGPHQYGVGSTHGEVVFFEPHANTSAGYSSMTTGYVIRPGGYSVRRIASQSAPSALDPDKEVVYLPDDGDNDIMIRARQATVACQPIVSRPKYSPSTYGNILASRVYGDRHNQCPATTVSAIFAGTGDPIYGNEFSQPAVAVQHNPLVGCLFVNNDSDDVIDRYEAVIDGAAYPCELMDDYHYDAAHTADVLGNVISPLESWMTVVSSDADHKVLFLVGHEYSNPGWVDDDGYTPEYLIMDTPDVLLWGRIDSTSVDDVQTLGVSKVVACFYAYMGFFPRIGFTGTVTYPSSGNDLATGNRYYIPLSVLADVCSTDNPGPGYRAWMDVYQSAFQLYTSESHAVLPNGDTAALQ